MQCHVCLSSEFILHDGFYFCQECNEKIEASRTEQAEQEGGFSKKSLLKSPAKEKKAKASEKKHLYSSWITTDGYNLIIYKQVSALISLGASEKLKTVVLYIWSKYLEKCEVAFRTDYRAYENVPRLSVFPRKRDIKVLYGDRNAKGKRKPNKKHLKRNGSKRKVEDHISDTDYDTSKEAVTSDDLESVSSDPKTSDSETESNTTSCASSRSKSGKSYKLSSHAQKIQRAVGQSKIKRFNSITKDNYVHHMTLQKTLSFCYLGLLYTEDQLLLCDLLRLVREDKVPYIDVTHVFPPSMPLQASDERNFTVIYVPTVKKISQMSAKLFGFLKLPNFKHRSLMPIVFRFVKDLNLPDSLIPIVNILHSKMKKHETILDTILHQNKESIPLYEVEAMALIIVALKHIFVLDGNFELEHSKIMTKINVLLKGTKLFVWKDWFQQMLLKEFLFIKKGCTYSDYSNLDNLSVDEIIKKYPMTRLREFGEFCSRKKCTKSIFHVGRKEIKTLLENVRNQNDAATDNKMSSFPLQYELSRFITEGESWQMFKETKERDFAFLNKTFSSDLIFYKRAEEISEESEELIYILLSSLYESKELLTSCDLSPYYQNIIKTSSKYWYKKLLASDFYDMKPLWRKKLPSTFVWLLELFSKYMQISCEELYTEVITVEKELSLYV